MDNGEEAELSEEQIKADDYLNDLDTSNRNNRANGGKKKIKCSEFKCRQNCISSKFSKFLSAIVIPIIDLDIVCFIPSTMAITLPYKVIPSKSYVNFHNGGNFNRRYEKPFLI